MRIVVISAFKEGFGGGSGRVAHDMARRFALEHDVALICPGKRTGLRVVGNGLQIWQIQSTGEGHVSIPRLSLKNVDAMFDFLDGFAPDVVHAHEPIALSLMGQIWSKIHRVPFIYTAHVLPSRTADFGAADVLKLPANAWAESLTQHMLDDFGTNCDALIALNDAAMADLAQRRYPGRLFSIPNARDLDTFGACQPADLSAPTKVLTFVGGITERKNQRYLAYVLAHLPDGYRLQLVGDAMDPAYGDEIATWAREQGLDDLVLTGPVDYYSIPAILERTHVFVSASKMEVQSLAVIEALASGTPVVGLANETVDELVDEEVGCRLDAAATPRAFARRVQSICSLSQTDYERLCDHARQRVAHLSWSQVQDLTVDAYQAVLSEYTVDAGRRASQLDEILLTIQTPEIRDALRERVERFNRAFHETVRPQSRLEWVRMTPESRRVPMSTWFYVTLTRLASSTLSFLWRSARLLRP